MRAIRRVLVPRRLLGIVLMLRTGPGDDPVHLIKIRVKRELGDRLRLRPRARGLARFLWYTKIGGRRGWKGGRWRYGRTTERQR